MNAIKLLLNRYKSAISAGSGFTTDISHIMKTLQCLLLTLCIASQLTAQVGVQLTAHINLRLDSIVARPPDLILIERDTLKLARMCAYSNYFEEADNLLIRYNTAHSD